MTTSSVDVDCDDVTETDAASAAAAAAATDTGDAEDDEVGTTADDGSTGADFRRPRDPATSK